MIFLNADLEITADEPLDAIRDAFASQGDRFFELHHGPGNEGDFFVSFEVHARAEDFSPDGREAASAQQKVEAFCEAIAGFPGPAMDSWRRAKKRVIDLGYQADAHGPPLQDFLDHRVISILAALEIHLAITIYPAMKTGEGVEIPSRFVDSPRPCDHCRSPNEAG